METRMETRMEDTEGKGKIGDYLRWIFGAVFGILILLMIAVPLYRKLFEG